MRKTSFTILSFVFLLTLLFINEGSSQYRGSGSGGDTYTRCNENCRPFTGQARYNCLRTCISATRRNQSPGSRRTSKYKQCADVCKSLKGLNNVKCIRICMERGSAAPARSRTGEDNSMLKSCERRCETLNQNYRYRCIRSCQKRHRRSR